MKGRFSKFFAVTALLLSICCLSAAPVSVHANAFDNVRTNVTQTQHTTTKKVKLSKKAKKNKTTTSTSRKTTYANSQPDVATSIHKRIDTTTTVKKIWKKGSKTKTVKTTVVTKTTTTTTIKYKGTIDVDKIAPSAHASLRSAFKQLGFTVVVDPYLQSYAGVFSVQNHKTTVKNTDTSIYHELGHFLSLVARNYCNTAEFKDIYNSEKGKYVGNIKSYATSTSSEYFAESYRDYLLNNNGLRSSRPRTYVAIQKCLGMVNATNIQWVRNGYGWMWN